MQKQRGRALLEENTNKLQISLEDAAPEKSSQSFKEAEEARLPKKGERGLATADEHETLRLMAEVSSDYQLYLYRLLESATDE